MGERERVSLDRKLALSLYFCLSLFVAIVLVLSWQTASCRRFQHLPQLFVDNIEEKWRLSSDFEMNDTPKIKINS